MLRRGIGAGLIAACMAVTAGAQQQPAEVHSTGPAGPIGLDVVVTDKAGHPIGGLQQSDFQLLDDGKPTDIRSFRAFGRQSDQEAPVQIILLVDAVNTPFIGVSRARTEIENYLHKDQGHLPAPVSIAYLTDNGLELTGKPTADGNALAEVLQNRRGDLRAITRAAGFYGAVERMQMSLQALEELTAREAQVPGRKLVIWVSPGWPVFDNPNVTLSLQDERGIFNSVVGLSSGLRQAQMTLYVVDPAGTWDAGSMRTFLWENYLKPVKKPSQANPGDLALQVLATQSGGRAMWGSNDVAGEVAQCVDDAKAWYRITFDPQRGSEGPTWHGLQVKVDRPGVKVRTRNGYYAQP